jgi:hypothetical protein
LYPLYLTLSPFINGYGFNRASKYFKALIEKDNFVTEQKHLYLFSRTDVVTCPDRLQDFIRARKRKIRKDGYDPEKVIFTADMNEHDPTILSPHVSHLLVQSNKYRQKLSDFLRRDVGLDLRPLK